MIRTKITLADLYVEDETAWLEAMADLLTTGDYAELDFVNLKEFLTDMAKRDRREVESRLVVFVTHVLKWVHQSEFRSRSWKSTIVEQRHELVRLVGRGVLRNHAEFMLPELYREAVERASIETGLSAASFPGDCQYSVDELLAFDPNGDPAAS